MAHSTKPQNLIGKRFGRLIVLKKLINKNDKRNWLCQCDCGKEHSAPGYSLKRGTTQSCGCFRIESHSLPGDEGSFNTIYDVYCRNAKNRNHEFSLSKKDFREITNRRCHYCGEPPQPFYSKNRKNDVEPFVCNGVDRINNSVGYIKENCVPCCGTCNFMKRDMSELRFREQMKKIASYVGGSDAK
jgi:hypothetical protein